MTKVFKWSFLILGCALALAALPTAYGETIFDNSTEDLQIRFDPGTEEIGDEIILTGGGFLTNFSFEYWGTAVAENFANPNVEARVRFYEMNGQPFNSFPTPGTVLFDSDWFGVPSPTDRNTFYFTSEFGPSGLFLPVTNLTWSIQFRNLGEGDHLGVDLYSPATIGQDHPDYWQNTGASWVLKQDPGGSVDFAAQFQAAVPEPSTLTLLVVGGIGAVLVARRKYPGSTSHYRNPQGTISAR